jgi:hypothetical protein
MRVDPLKFGDESEILEKTARITPQWVAGFFDGDGHVGITVQTGPSRKYLRPKCTFTGKDCLVLAIIASKYGFGGPFLKESKKYKSDVYEIESRGGEIHPFLAMIRPYVVIRRPQVELAIEFCEKFLVGSGYRLSQEQYDQAMIIRNKISEMNGAGKKLVPVRLEDLCL